MLKPSVGLMVSMSSPLNFFRIVVFPALSSPLQHHGRRAALPLPARAHSQDQQAHFLLLLLQLLQDRQQPHGCRVGSAGDRAGRYPSQSLCIKQLGVAWTTI
jgi:hypothetical protein